VLKSQKTKEFQMLKEEYRLLCHIMSVANMERAFSLSCIDPEDLALARVMRDHGLLRKDHGTRWVVTMKGSEEFYLHQQMDERSAQDAANKARSEEQQKKFQLALALVGAIAAVLSALLTILAN
jgi:hypothetical protein